MNDQRELAGILSLGRVAIGAMLFLAPARTLKAWMGRTDASAGAIAAARGLGARDVAIGLGTLVALERESGASTWLQAGAIADAADTVSELGAFGDMPSGRRWLWLAVSGGAAILGMQLASAIDD